MCVRTYIYNLVHAGSNKVPVWTQQTLLIKEKVQKSQTPAKAKFQRLFLEIIKMADGIAVLPPQRPPPPNQTSTMSVGVVNSTHKYSTDNMHIVDSRSRSKVKPESSSTTSDQSTEVPSSGRPSSTSPDHAPTILDSKHSPHNKHTVKSSALPLRPPPSHQHALTNLEVREPCDSRKPCDSVDSESVKTPTEHPSSAKGSTPPPRPQAPPTRQHSITLSPEPELGESKEVNNKLRPIRPPPPNIPRPQAKSVTEEQRPSHSLRERSPTIDVTARTNYQQACQNKVIISPKPSTTTPPVSTSVLTTPPKMTSPTHTPMEPLVDLVEPSEIPQVSAQDDDEVHRNGPTGLCDLHSPANHPSMSIQSSETTPIRPPPSQSPTTTSNDNAIDQEPTSPSLNPQTNSKTEADSHKGPPVIPARPYLPPRPFPPKQNPKNKTLPKPRHPPQHSKKRVRSKSTASPKKPHKHAPKTSDVVYPRTSHDPAPVLHDTESEKSQEHPPKSPDAPSLVPQSHDPTENITAIMQSVEVSEKFRDNSFESLDNNPNTPTLSITNHDTVEFGFPSESNKATPPDYDNTLPATLDVSVSLPATLAQQQESSMEERDEVAELSPSRSSPKSGGKRILNSMKKSFRSLRLPRKQKTSASVQRSRSDAATFSSKVYPDPLPQGIVEPLVVKCVAYLNRIEVLVEEGLFRIPGDMAAIKRLRVAFINGVNVNLDEVLDPHTVCGLLKLHFRELRVSLIPRGPTLTNLIHHVKQGNVSEVRDLINTINVTHIATLRMVTEVLVKVVDHCDVNKMTSGTLATSCGPSMFPYLPPSNSNQLLKFLIDNCQEIFET